jgi:zinc-ribbon domain
MAYACELGTGQRIYLDNQGMQTMVTAMSGGPGQQQQSSTGFQTGSWIAPPEMFQIAGGAVLKVTTAQGEHFIYIQGNSMQVMGGVPSLSGSQQMQVQQVSRVPPSSMPPMEPMKPMNMGGMQMNPMEMRMGDMEMRMGSASAPNTPSTRRFCSQCGTAIEAEDRFCSSCGHRLV